MGKGTASAIPILVLSELGLSCLKNESVWPVSGGLARPDCSVGDVARQVREVLNISKKFWSRLPKVRTLVSRECRD